MKNSANSVFSLFTYSYDCSSINSISCNDFCIMNNDNTVQTTTSVVCITSDGDNPSYFDQRDIELSGDQQRVLSEQIQALNFRLRESPSNYVSGWHVANDPTLLIILSGSISVELRNGKNKKFIPGEMFVAQDFIAEGKVFDSEKHGHRASVVGNEKLVALHLKLSKR